MDSALDTASAAPAVAPLSVSLRPLVLALAMSFGMTVGSAARAANFTVTNLNDAGAGSLRQAIADANSVPGPDTITFASGLGGTITLTSGELEVSDALTLQGPGSALLTVSGNNASRVLNLYNNSSVVDITISGLTIANGNAANGGGIRNLDERLTLDDVTLRDNHSTNDGGGLWADGFNMVLTVRNSLITGNTASQDGGGVYVEDTGGTLLIQNSTISGNQAGKHGGGIYLYDPDHDVTIENSTISSNVAGQKGGGIYFYSADNGTFTIRNSTIAGNQAQDGGGAYLFKVDQPTFIENSTISGNVAVAGGGLRIQQSLGIQLTHVTIADNTASAQGGGLLLDNGSATLTNTLVAGNSTSSAASGNDILRPPSASFNAQNSLIQDAPAGTINGSNTGNILGAAPLLGPLQNNGGPTRTHALLAGSPAIDAGASGGALATDQRGAGFLRSVGAAPDIGAFEWQASVSITGASTVPVGQAASFTIVLSEPSPSPVTVTVTPTGSGSSPAIPGVDFDATPVTVTIPPGSTSVTFSIPTFAGVPPGVGRSLTATITSAIGSVISSGGSAAASVTLGAALATHQIPTLSQWTLGLLAGLLALAARLRGRPRRTRP